ncbi:hypothetical protein [Peptococcus simiae]|uniref:hypothetical protein n=1 Tax=Peptococcus simiae TaxID=1643805 RepID=UPI0039815B52
MIRSWKKGISIGMVGLLLALPAAGFAGEFGNISVNGKHIDLKDDRQMYLEPAGITMIRADFLPGLYVYPEKKGDTLYLKGQDGLKITWQIGAKKFTVNGEQKTAPVPAVEKETGIYLPLRALITAIGDVDWVTENKSIHLITDYGQIKAPARIQSASQPLASESRLILESDQPAAQMPLDLDYDGKALYATAVDELGRIKGLKDQDGQVVLSPVQENANLVTDTWRLSEKDQVWAEYATDGDWRLYEKDRQSTKSPQLIDQAPVQEMDIPQAPMQRMAATDSHIAYVKWDKAKKSLALILYDRTAHEKKVLAYSATGHFNLALNDRNLAWVETNSLTPLRNVGRLNLLSLADGKQKTLKEGVSLDLPVLSGDHLLVFYRPYGMNFIDQADGTMLAGAIWHYNLKTDKWDWQLDNKSSIFKDGPKTVVQVFNAQPLGDKYALILPETLKDAETIPVINLEKGTVAPLVNTQGDPLNYGQGTTPQELLMTAKTAQNGNLLVMTAQKSSQDMRVVRAKEVRIDQ